MMIPKAVRDHLMLVSGSCVISEPIPDGWAELTPESDERVASAHAAPRGHTGQGMSADDPNYADRSLSKLETAA